MSGFGIAPIPSVNPLPQLPGQVQIVPPTKTPGNPIAAPVIPSSAPPNVSGGSASFSDSTSAINDLIKAKSAELDASARALTSNTSVDASASTQITALQKNTLDAYGNIQKAASLPGGVTGHLAKILGIFDSDYNVELQKINVEKNQLSATTISNTAAALKEQNNQLPALLGKVSEAQDVILKAQQQANDLVLKQGTLTVEQQNAKINAARLRLDMTKEQREAANFKINSAPLEVLQAQLPNANAGKGPFAGLGGLIQERIMSEQTAAVALGNAQNALKKGNRQEYEDSTVDALTHFPPDLLAANIAQAQKDGKATVSLPVSVDDKGKVVMGEVPLDLAGRGMVAGYAIQKQVNESVAADQTQRLNIIPDVTNLSNTLNSFASMDPRTTQLYSQLGSIMGSMNAKDPNSVRQTALLIAPIKEATTNIVKEQAAKQTTLDAKAAVISYGSSGKFDSVGGTSVVADSVGIPSLNTNSLYKNAWKSLATQVANVVQTEHITKGAIAAPTGSSTADAMAFMASLQQTPSGRETLNRITTNTLADPNKLTDIRNQMKGTIQVKSVNDVLMGLSSQKNANPIWGQIMQNKDQYKNAKGSLDPAKLFEAFEQAKILSHGKIDYSSAFLDGLRNYAVNADNTSASDPSYTMQDHALEASIFGGSPRTAVLGDLHYQLRVLAARQAKAMQDRIKQDLNGQTAAQAVKQATIDSGSSMETSGGFGSFMNQDADTIFKKTGVDVTSLPSATGTGMTVAQIQAIYGGGK